MKARRNACQKQKNKTQPLRGLKAEQQQKETKVIFHNFVSEQMQNFYSDPQSNGS